jgi:CRISPR/Cas system-associated endonuclease Cas1
MRINSALWEIISPLLDSGMLVFSRRQRIKFGDAANFCLSIVYHLCRANFQSTQCQRTG